MMGEEQSPVMNHRVTNVVSGVGMGGLGGIARMRNSHSSQDVASITNEQDYWAYGPGIVDRSVISPVRESRVCRVLKEIK